MMKTMLSTLMTITISSLTARPTIVLTLPLLCAGATSANCPEFQNPAPVQQSAASPRSGQAADAKPEGDWEGTLDAGPVKLRIVVHITRNEGAYSATLDSPDQGALGIPIEACAACYGRDQFLRDLGRRAIAIPWILVETTLHDRI